jgi:hypothetical protein
MHVTFALLLALSGLSQFAIAKEAHDESSSSARSQIAYSAGVELYLGVSLAGSYQINRDTAAELFWETRPLDFWSGCAVGESAKSSGYLTGARLRRYFGNSFNVTLGPYVRRDETHCEWTGRNATPRGESATPAVGSSRLLTDRRGLGITASVGNRWQWRRFYLGAEWLGLGLDRTMSPSGSEGSNELHARLMLLRLVMGASL